MKKIKTGILGATGYTGAELARLLSGHPAVSLELVTSSSFAGQDLGDVYPSLHLRTARKLKQFKPQDAAKNGLDVVFVAYPAGAAFKFIPALLKAGMKVIDLGADFRFKNALTYKKYYKISHPCVQFLKESAFGLPELFAAEIKKARLVANPGCYVIAALLALAPLLKDGSIDLTDVIVDAKSGVSGAGKTPSPAVHFAECDENLSPYKVFEHRHQPEMVEAAGRLAGRKVEIAFVPQLVPMTRGILASIYVKLKKKSVLPVLRAKYKKFYQNAEFVRLLKPGQLPATKQVCGSNYCDIALRLAGDGRRLAVFSVIDNLVKGASGNAVQNMNLMFGLEESAGLSLPALYP